VRGVRRLLRMEQSTRPAAVLAHGRVTIPATSCPTSVAAEQDWPRLRVWQSPYLDWRWQVTAPDGEPLVRGVADTHPEALAVGLAALEQTSLAVRRPARW
jgi:hypothetical protein